jgi:hypothetical protein
VRDRSDRGRSSAGQRGLAGGRRRGPWTYQSDPRRAGDAGPRSAVVPGDAGLHHTARWPSP